MDTFWSWIVWLWWLWLPLSVYGWFVFWALVKGERSFLPDSWEGNLHFGITLVTFFAACLLALLTIGTLIVIFGKGVSALL